MPALFLKKTSHSARGHERNKQQVIWVVCIFFKQYIIQKFLNFPLYKNIILTLKYYLFRTDIKVKMMPI